MTAVKRKIITVDRNTLAEHVRAWYAVWRTWEGHVCTIYDDNTEWKLLRAFEIEISTIHGLKPARETIRRGEGGISWYVPAGHLYTYTSDVSGRGRRTAMYYAYFAKWKLLSTASNKITNFCITLHPSSHRKGRMQRSLYFLGVNLSLPLLWVNIATRR